MSRELRKATVLATKQQIEVYSRTAGGWVDFADCKTVYQENELAFKDG
jgi:hypothetical protein